MTSFADVDDLQPQNSSPSEEYKAAKALVYVLDFMSPNTLDVYDTLQSMRNDLSANTVYSELIGRAETELSTYKSEQQEEYAKAKQTFLSSLPTCYSNSIATAAAIPDAVSAAVPGVVPSAAGATMGGAKLSKKSTAGRRKVRGGADVNLAQELSYIANTENLRITDDPMMQAGASTQSSLASTAAPFSAGANTRNAIYELPPALGGTFDLKFGGGTRKPAKAKKESKPKTDAKPKKATKPKKA